MGTGLTFHHGIPAERLCQWNSRRRRLLLEAPSHLVLPNLPRIRQSGTERLVTKARSKHVAGPDVVSGIGNGGHTDCVEVSQRSCNGKRIVTPRDKVISCNRFAYVRLVGARFDIIFSIVAEAAGAVPSTTMLTGD